MSKCILSTTKISHTTNATYLVVFLWWNWLNWSYLQRTHVAHTHDATPTLDECTLERFLCYVSAYKFDDSYSFSRSFLTCLSGCCDFWKTFTRYCYCTTLQENGFSLRILLTLPAVKKETWNSHRNSGLTVFSASLYTAKEVNFFGGCHYTPAAALFERVHIHHSTIWCIPIVCKIFQFNIFQFNSHDQWLNTSLLSLLKFVKYSAWVHYNGTRKNYLSESAQFKWMNVQELEQCVGIKNGINLDCFLLNTWVVPIFVCGY